MRSASCNGALSSSIPLLRDAALSGLTRPLNHGFAFRASDVLISPGITIGNGGSGVSSCNVSISGGAESAYVAGACLGWMCGSCTTGSAYQVTVRANPARGLVLSVSAGSLSGGSPLPGCAQSRIVDDRVSSQVSAHRWLSLDQHRLSHGLRQPAGRSACKPRVLPTSPLPSLYRGS